MIRKQKRLGCLTALLLGLTACADGSRDIRPASLPDPSPVVISEASASYGGGDVQKGGRNLGVVLKSGDAEANPSVVTLNQGSALQERPLSSSDDLPAKINVPPSTLYDVPVSSALQAILAGTNIPLAWSGSAGDRMVTVENLTGSLPVVVNKFCTIAQVFCSYRNGSLEIQTEEAFVVKLPPQDKNSQIATVIGSGILSVLNHDAGNKIQIDPQGESVLYTADVASQDKVHTYLEQLRNGRPLISMQLYVWDVALDDATRHGIDWSAMQTGRKALKTAKSNQPPSLEPKDETASGVSLNAIALDQVNIAALAEFLSTQGRLKTIDNSQVAFAANVTPPSTTSSAEPHDAAKDDSSQLLSDGKGVDIGVKGAYDKGLVVADLHLALKDDRSLPSGAKNLNVDAIIRVHPGDNLVLAGVITPPSPSSDGVLRNKQDYKAHEIVIVAKPTVYLFANMPAALTSKASPPAIQETIAQIPTTQPPPRVPLNTLSAPSAPKIPIAPRATPSALSETDWPMPVVIDKDGAKPLMELMQPPLPPPTLPPMLTPSTMDDNVPASVIYNSTNAAVLENLSIPYPSTDSGGGL